MLSPKKETGVFVPRYTAGVSALGTKYSFGAYDFYLAPGKIKKPGYHDVFALAIQDLSPTPANNTYMWLGSFLMSQSNTPLLDLAKNKNNLDIKSFLILENTSKFPLNGPVYIITDPEEIINFYAFIGSKIKELLSPILEDLLEEVIKEKSKGLAL